MNQRCRIPSATLRPGISPQEIPATPAFLEMTAAEPFEIPARSKFDNKTLTERFFSSAFYADSCLGDFIQRFRQTKMWNNTLVILVADHGSRLPDFDDIFEPRKHHIPLLWTGGAVVRDTVVNKTGSQADLAITLLRQLGIKRLVVGIFAWIKVLCICHDYPWLCLLRLGTGREPVLLGNRPNSGRTRASCHFDRALSLRAPSGVCRWLAVLFIYPSSA